jgi:hypothetical protein
MVKLLCISFKANKPDRVIALFGVKTLFITLFISELKIVKAIPISLQEYTNK